jgi:multidrug efflux pump
MNFTEFFIKRPVMTIIVNSLIVIIGILSFNSLELREYPKVIVPTLDVSVNYPGVSAAVIESNVTNILEDVLAGLPGLDSIESRTEEGQCDITLNFINGTNIEGALANIREYLAQARHKLPKEIEEPSIKRQSSSEKAFFYIGVNSDTLSNSELTHYAMLHIKNKLRTVKGLAEVKIWGENYVMKIELNINKINNLKLNFNDIIDAINKNQKNYPAGKFQNQVNTSIINVIDSEEDFANLIIKNDSSGQLFLKDIAEIKLIGDDKDFQVKLDNKNAVIIGLVKASDSNPLEVVKAINEEIFKIKEQLPNNIKLTVVDDQTSFIRDSLHNLKKAIIEAIFLVIIVIWLSLKNFRSSIIPMITIPISLIGTFFIIKICGLSINVITMLAMVLAIGLVVDDAIIVLENIYKYIEKGLTPSDAAVKGSKEIIFAIIAMTLTLASVYLPILFIDEVIGKIFSEFAITLAGSVIISGITAITLSPLMCSYFIRPINHITPYNNSKNDFYLNILNIFFKHKYLFIVVFIALISCTYLLFKTLPKELAPKEDRNEISAYVPPVHGKSYSNQQNYLNHTYNIIKDHIPDSNSIITYSGPWGGQIIVPLKRSEERSQSASEIASKLDKKLKDIPSIDVYAWSRDNGLPGVNLNDQSSNTLSVKIQTTHSYEQLYNQLKNFKKSLEQHASYLDMYSNLDINHSNLKIVPDKYKMAKLGINNEDLSVISQIYFNEYRPLKFHIENIDYYVSFSNKYQPWSLEEVHMLNKNGKTISAGSFAKFEQFYTPETLTHYNQMRSTELNLGLKSASVNQQQIDLFNDYKEKYLPSNLKIEFIGLAKMLQQTTNTMLLLIFLAIIFIYSVLAIQFESFIDPLIIIVTVPLATFGALLTLKIFGLSLNIFSQIGIITLIGLITKHGILIIEFANTSVKEGLSLVDAIKQSVTSRMRPIIMTTSAMVFGSIPLIISSGAGAEARKAIGYVIAGGLSFGTLLTLFLIPSCYLLFKKNILLTVKSKSLAK